MSKIDLKIAMILLEELENQYTHTRVRGYAAGHPHWGRKIEKQVLGSSPFADEEEDTSFEFEHTPVKISKAFKK